MPLGKIETESKKGEEEKKKREKSQDFNVQTSHFRGVLEKLSHLLYVSVCGLPHVVVLYDTGQ